MPTDKSPSALLYCEVPSRPSLRQLWGREHNRQTLKWLRHLSRAHVANGHHPLAIFAFDYIGHKINIDGVYEKADLDFLFRALKQHEERFRRTTVLDIGANIGNHSLYFSDRFRKVISFEPNPRTFKLLQLNADLVSNVDVRHTGASDTVGQFFMQMPGTNSGCAAIQGDTRRAPDDIAITVSPLDSLIDHSDEVSLIKIDVEGHECNVLRGAEQLLRQQKPIILFEQHAADFLGGSTSAIKILETFGYTQFAVIDKQPGDYQYLPGFMRRRTKLLLSLILGEKRNLVVKPITPGSYPFIVALPDWATSG